MALTFPLSAADFADTLPISKVTWALQDNREFSGLGSGQIIDADLAPELWTGEVELDQRDHAKMAAIEAKVEALISRKGTFYLYDPRRREPIAQPPAYSLTTPAVLTLDFVADAYSVPAPSGPYEMIWLDFVTDTYVMPSTPTISALPNAYSMRLESLLPGQVLSVGDMLAFDYGSPTRRALHRILETVVADASGVSPAFEVSPFIRPGATVGATVSLLKPSMVCRVVPKTFRPTSVSTLTSSAAFSVIQVI